MAPVRRAGRSARALRAEAGFTLIELLFTLVLLGILGALAAPSFRDFVASQRIRAASGDLTSVLMLARSEAIKRNASVAVTAQGGSWTNGWSLLSGATTLARHEAFAGVSIAAPVTTVTYTANGRVSAAVSQFAISSADNASAAARCVRIDLTGMTTAYSGAGCP